MTLREQIEYEYERSGFVYTDEERAHLSRFWRTIRPSATAAQKDTEALYWVRGRLEALTLLKGRGVTSPVRSKVMQTAGEALGL